MLIYRVCYTDVMNDLAPWFMFGVSTFGSLFCFAVAAQWRKQRRFLSRGAPKNQDYPGIGSEWIACLWGTLIGVFAFLSLLDALGYRV